MRGVGCYQKLEVGEPQEALGKVLGEKDTLTTLSSPVLPFGRSPHRALQEASPGLEKHTDRTAGRHPARQEVDEENDNGSQRPHGTGCVRDCPTGFGGRLIQSLQGHQPRTLQVRGEFRGVPGNP